MSYIPIHIHTVWSLLDSSIAIPKLANKAKEYNIPAMCLTDHHNIKGVVSFVNEINKVGIKPIIGMEVNIWNEMYENIDRVTVLCKNKTGYKNLLQILHKSNEYHNIHNGEPTIHPLDFINLKSGLLLLMGDMMCPLAKYIFKDWNSAYLGTNLELRSNYLDLGISFIQDYTKNFGDDFFLFTDKSSLEIINVLNKCITKIGQETKIQILASNNVHYLDKLDKAIHQVLLRAKIENVKKVNDSIEDFYDYRIFLTEQPYCHLLPSLDNGDSTLLLLDIIEDFSIKERPILPKFKLKDHTILNPDEILYQLCRDGFKQRQLSNDLKNDRDLFKKYGDRAKTELKLFSRIGLSAYFLIVQDIVKFCKENGIPADVRGSSTACLINYLLGISSIDPLRPDPSLSYNLDRELPLSRFFNEGRSTEERISLPDVDLDVPPSFRQNIIDYLKEKYGKDCVAHIITHSRFKGKGAIKEVFKLSNLPNYFEISDRITKSMVDEAKISDQLAEIKENNPDYGIIQWNIDNIKEIEEAYQEYQAIFDLAIEIEQIPKHPSVHAAGIIIADEPLYRLFPTCFSEKLNEHIVAIEGQEIEQLGALKLDLLGVSMLEKIKIVEIMVNSQMNTIPSLV